MSEEEDDDLVVPRPDAPIVEEPYPYWLLNPRTGAALDIRHFVYGDFFWNIDRVYGKKPVYKADDGIDTFVFTVVWRETWHSRAMIRQLGQLRPHLRFWVRERVHRNVNGFQEFLVKWSPTKEFFVNFSDHYKRLVEEEHGYVPSLILLSKTNICCTNTFYVSPCDEETARSQYLERNREGRPRLPHGLSRAIRQIMREEQGYVSLLLLLYQYKRLLY